MALSLDSLVTKANPKPPIMVVHGLHGLGKTSFGAAAPKPVGIFTEDGKAKLEFPSFPIAQSYADVIDAIGVLYNDPHDFKTLVFDSLDHFEPLVWAETCRRNGWSSIEDAGYGKGYIEADAVWAEFFSALTDLRNDRNMIIYAIAHTQITAAKAIDSEPYDKYVIKLHKRAAALVLEKADIVGFLHRRVSTKDNDTTKASKKDAAASVRGSGLGPRTLFVEADATKEAKNRYGLPPEIPLGGVSEMPDTWDKMLDCVFS